MRVNALEAISTKQHFMGLCDPEENIVYTLEGRTHDKIAEEIVKESIYLSNRFSKCQYVSYLDFLLFDQGWLKIGNQYGNQRIVIIGNKDSYRKFKNRDEYLEILKSCGYKIENVSKF